MLEMLADIYSAQGLLTWEKKLILVICWIVKEIVSEVNDIHFSLTCWTCMRSGVIHKNPW